MPVKQEIRMLQQELKISLKKDISGWEIKQENIEKSIPPTDGVHKNKEANKIEESTVSRLRNFRKSRNSGRQILKNTEGN